jgi:hypothetical protein
MSFSIVEHGTNLIVVGYLPYLRTKHIPDGSNSKDDGFVNDCDWYWWDQTHG